MSPALSVIVDDDVRRPKRPRVPIALADAPFAVCVIAVAVTSLLAGCTAQPEPSDSPATTSASQPAPRAPASASESPAGDNTAEPRSTDQDGNTQCAAFDSWRPASDSAGITVTYWFEDHDPVTVLVKQPGVPDVSTTNDDDPAQRYQIYQFSDVNPQAVTEVLATSTDKTCFINGLPAQ